MTRKLTNLAAQVCRGWAGVWSDGTIGWAAPEHLSPRNTEAPRERAYVRADDRFYLCEIIVRPLRDSRKRLITRRALTIGASKPEQPKAAGRLLDGREHNAAPEGKT